MQRPLYLIGFMCSGKTTLGEALARATCLPFVDLDQMIESQQGMSISQIFATKGEEAFRQIESEALRSVSEGGGAIIACGGGTPCRAGAMQMMLSRGTVVYLRPKREKLVERLMLGRDKRPLVAVIKTKKEMSEFVDSKLAERELYYLQAHSAFDSSALETAAEIEDSVKKFIQKYSL